MLETFFVEHKLAVRHSNLKIMQVKVFVLVLVCPWLVEVCIFYKVFANFVIWHEILFYNKIITYKKIGCLIDTHNIEFDM